MPVVRMSTLNPTKEQRGYGVGFQRIRRITGYTSDVSTWNNSKRHELEDRVKHI